MISSVVNLLINMSSDDDCDSQSSTHKFKKSADDQFTKLTGILFGNIDDEGHLVDDILDEESKRHLSSLQRHLNSLLPLNEEDIKNEDEGDDVLGQSDVGSRERTDSVDSEPNKDKHDSQEEKGEDSQDDGGDGKLFCFYKLFVFDYRFGLIVYI